MSAVWGVALAAACLAEVGFGRLAAGPASEHGTVSTVRACLLARIAIDALLVLYLYPARKSPTKDDVRWLSWPLVAATSGWAAIRLGALIRSVQLFDHVPAWTAQLATLLELPLTAVLLRDERTGGRPWLKRSAALALILGLVVMALRAAGTGPVDVAAGMVLESSWLQAVSHSFFAVLVDTFGLCGALAAQLAAHLAAFIVCSVWSDVGVELPWLTGALWAWRGASFTPIFRHVAAAEHGALLIVVARLVRSVGSALLLAAPIDQSTPGFGLRALLLFVAIAFLFWVATATAARGTPTPPTPLDTITRTLEVSPTDDTTTPAFGISPTDETVPFARFCRWAGLLACVALLSLPTGLPPSRPTSLIVVEPTPSSIRVDTVDGANGSLRPSMKEENGDDASGSLRPSMKEENGDDASGSLRPSMKDENGDDASGSAMKEENGDNDVGRRRRRRWRVGVWSAAGNGNLGDNLMPRQWETHFRSLARRPGEAPWSSVEVWSLSARTCCYSFSDEWRKVSVPEDDPRDLIRRVRADFDVLWIGGGGLLGFGHPPWTHNAHDWQRLLLGMPTVWASVGTSGLANWTRPVLALATNDSATLWRPRDPPSLRFLQLQAAERNVRGDFALLWDPVLADNLTFPARVEDGQKMKKRVCWIPRVTPKNDGLLWMQAQYDRDRDAMIIFEEKDNYLANFDPDVRLQTNDAQGMWHTLRQCEMVISMRYHGCILALRAMRPTIAMVPADELNVPLSKFTELMIAVDQRHCLHPAISVTWPDVLRCVERFCPDCLWNQLHRIQHEFRDTLVQTLRSIATIVPP